MENERSVDKSQHLLKFVGQKVAVLCARYTYWGRLSEVGTGYIVLATASAVEQSGPASGASPTLADPINGSITIFTDAIEIVFQPTWSQGTLPGEE